MRGLLRRWLAILSDFLTAQYHRAPGSCCGAGLSVRELEGRRDTGPTTPTARD